MKRKIKYFFKWIFGWIKGMNALMLSGVFLTLIWFDIDWCMTTTFTAMSNPHLYLVTITVSLLLLAPWIFTHSRIVGILILLILALISEANLLYCRTYWKAISPKDYLLAGNMVDFTDSIWPNLKWMDLGFIVILAFVTVACFLLKDANGRKVIKQYIALTAIFTLLLAANILAQGGFYKAYQDATFGGFRLSCGVPSYTIGGHVIYKLIEEQRFKDLDEKELKVVDNWIQTHKERYNINKIENPRKSVVLIICESLESWPIELKFQGKEITPLLNSLVNDSTTFYAPNVLAQVSVGNSIDGQLIYTTGLLPTSNMVYSVNYSDRNFPSMNKILKKDRDAKSILLTVDKPVVWNMIAVNRAFGYDTIIHGNNWKRNETMRHKITDGSFFKQSVDLLKKGELWPEGRAGMLTLITISGHSPFKLNRELRDPNFDISNSGLPKLIEDYIITAHYVDSQLKIIIDYLKGRSDTADTMIVILGDHNRRDHIDPVMVSDVLVGNGMHIPFIVINSPVAGRYGGVLGQADVFPTLLDLLRVSNYEWRGMGISIFDPNRPEVAFSIDPPMMEGEVGEHSEEEIEHIKSAHSISELIIINDLYGKKIAK